MAVKVPPTEVSAKASRRVFTAEYKQRIVREAAACTDRGGVAALLRREGLYSSHLAAWRTQGARAGTARRGPPPTPPDARDRTIADLQRQLAKAEARAARAEALVDLQKKLSALLGESIGPGSA